MESHPIPQQISSYQFRLVGDMTLKQFFQLGGGALVALLLYSTHILPIFKWPLMILSFSLGAALAFLPFEERPLSKWLVAFFRSIYSPTIFNWVSQPNPIFFQNEIPEPQVGGIAAPQGQASLNTYLKSLPQTNQAPVAKLDSEEAGFLSKITALFTPTPQVTAPPGGGAMAVSHQDNVPVTVPTQTPVAIPKDVRPKMVVEEDISQVAPVTSPFTLPVLPDKPLVPAQAPQFSSEAAPPSLPSIPNTLMGQVMDDKGKIVEGAILEIRDMAGRPVRALRSNKVGHFMVVTALTSGEYEIVTEKEGLKFEPVAFKATGEIIPPIMIKAGGSFEVKNAPYTGKPLIIN